MQKAISFNIIVLTDNMQILCELSTLLNCLLKIGIASARSKRDHPARDFIDCHTLRVRNDEKRTSVMASECNERGHPARDFIDCHTLRVRNDEKRTSVMASECNERGHPVYAMTVIAV